MLVRQASLVYRVLVYIVFESCLILVLGAPLHLKPYLPHWGWNLVWKTCLQPRTDVPGPKFIKEDYSLKY